MSCSSLSNLCSNATSNILRRSRVSGCHHASPCRNPVVDRTPTSFSLSSRSNTGLLPQNIALSGRVGALSRSFATLSPLLLASEHQHSSETNATEFLLSATAAIATSAALVSAYPSATKKPSGGGGGGPPRLNHSVMYAGAPLQEEEAVQERSPQLSNDKEISLIHRQNGAYEISARAIKGGRLTMEDEYFVADGGRFAAVFDGHGGGGVSAFLKHHLYSRRTHTLEQLQEIEGRQQPTLADQVSALREAFNQTENDILRDDSLQYQGSTAVAVVVHDAGDGHRTVLSANVGDSRAILSRNGHAVELTRDHKPNEERERARILSMGETIEWDHFAKVHRVRNLSLSRAMGDRYAKPYVSAEVEIMRFPVDEHGDEFVLLASDGLWDVMTSQDVVSYVHRQIAKEMGRNHHMDKEEKERFRHVLRRNMSKYVAREALKRGSGDNVCVVMVWLDDDVKNGKH